MMVTIDDAVQLILDAYPATQAIYLYGSYGTAYEGSGSDVDIAVLLPHELAKEAGSLALSPLRVALEQTFRREVDLVNLRRTSTVLQKEVVAADRRVYASETAEDAYAVAEFEMLVLSFYQKLNEERKEILEAFLESGKAYDV